MATIARIIRALAFLWTDRPQQTITVAPPASASKESHLRLPDLPTEILQQTAGSCTEETLQQFRLTCKVLEAATLAQFADAYFSQLECFILDPARLLRALKILSSPHLAARIRRVVLTLCTTDSIRMPHLAPQPSEDFMEARERYWLENEEEQYSLSVCRKQALTSDNEALIGDILRKTVGLNCCSFGIEVQSEDAAYAGISDLRPQLAKELIEMVLRAGGTIDAIRFSDKYALEASQFESRGALEHIIHGLRDFSYQTAPLDKDALQTAHAQQHWRIITAVLRSANKLQEFELNECADFADVEYGEVLPRLCGQAFTEVYMPFLRRLSLKGINAPMSTLLNTFDSCGGSLEEIALGCLGVIEDGDVWSVTLSRLSKMPNLHTMSLACLYKRASDVDTFKSQGWLKAEYLPSADRDRRLCIQMANEGPVVAHPLLERIIEREFEYVAIG